MKQNKYLLVFAFLCGLGSSLFVTIPFGRVAMFDFATYFFAPFLFVTNYSKFTRAEHRLLLFSLLWLVGAVWSNWWRQEPFGNALKGCSIVFNVWCMLVVAIVLLKKSYKTWFWFSVGWGIASVISLYYFQNGAYLEGAEKQGYTGKGGVQEFLVEKQIYPVYANTFFFSVLFPLRIFKRIPWIIISVGQIAIGFLLLFKGGSRSNFGICLLVGLFMFGFAYQKQVIRGLLRNFIVFVVASGIVAGLLLKTYTYLASTGVLGEGEYNRYVEKITVSGLGAMEGRDDIVVAWPFLKRHPIVGSGASATDRWGYTRLGTLPWHSALIGAWVKDGIFGLVFWVFAIGSIVQFLRKRMLFWGDWTPFVFGMLVQMLWAILFSPFGVYRGIVCMVLALCVVSQDPVWMQRVKRELNG